jgi:transcriptional regulator with XRE-family HTH domain
MELGKIIKRLREEHGWSQDELAFRTGTSAANISRIENGRHGASEALLILLSKEFELKVYQLIALAEGISSPDIPKLSNPDEEIVLSAFRKMTDKQRELFKAIGIEFSS